MEIKLLRNATLLLDYAGTTFLIDPMLADKGSYAPFPNSPRQDENNPLVPLPMKAEEAVENTDAIIVTHLHIDHFDETAKEIIPKDKPLFVQNEADKEEIEKSGFSNIQILSNNTEFEGVQLVKTKGQHGRGEILKVAGDVCGVVFKHAEEKTLYVAGDTVWYEAVEEELRKHDPDVIVANGGDNQFDEGGPLVMNKEDIHLLHKKAPESEIIVVHMEAVNHWTLSREELRSSLSDKGITNVIVPEDGETMTP